MMKNVRFYLIFSGLGVIIILLSVIPGLRMNPLSDLSGESRAFLPIRTGEVPKLEIQNFKLIQTTGEKKQWELEAIDALEYEEGNEIQIKNTNIKFFKNNKVVLNLKADNGIVDLETKNIRIIGNVEANSSDGLKLKTKSLNWVSADEKLITDDNIVFTKGGIRVEGKGLEADVGLGKLQVKKSARVEVPRK